MRLCALPAARGSWFVALRDECRAGRPDWSNAPVHAFGDPDAWLAFAGLAPGKHGANRTRRPFTGNYAGDLLFATLVMAADMFRSALMLRDQTSGRNSSTTAR